LVFNVSLFRINPRKSASSVKAGPNFSEQGKMPERRNFMRHYETIFIINPSLSDDEYKNIVQKYNGILEKNKGAIIKTDLWGVQRLAYPVRKEEKGFYVLLDYCGLSGLTAELEHELKLDDRVLKYQTVKLADKADPEELIRQIQEKAAKKEQAAADENPGRPEESAKMKEVPHGN
jgi:small subunit ribosomal protein S6